MKIKLLVGLAHPDKPVNAGEVIDVEQAEAIRHIEAGHAIPHGDKAIETPEKPTVAVEKRAPAKKPAKKK